MSELVRALREAWARVWPRLEREPGEAMKRWLRMRQALLRRPLRGWCLAVRASDTRIGEYAGELYVDEELEERAYRHPVLLTPEGLRLLCGPVRIDPPGVPLSEAGRLLGRSPEAMRAWLPVRPGRRAMERRERGVRAEAHFSTREAVFEVTYRRADAFGHTGVEVPVVWVRGGGALDPSAGKGERPQALWGDLWERGVERLEADWVQEVDRVARWRRYPASCWRSADPSARRFCGWEWVCPGRPVIGAWGERPTGHRGPEGWEDVAWRPCGKRALSLYYPLRTVGSWLGEGEAGGGAAVAEGGAAAAAGPERWVLRLGHGLVWRPAVDDPLAWRRVFACQRCWRVRWESTNPSVAWNDVVSWLSNGVLYGREVRQPCGVRA